MLEGAARTCACSASTPIPALSSGAARLGRFGDRVRLTHATFADLETVAASHGVAEARAILLDLGVSSWQLDASGRGFSFQRDEPLDMRLDPTRGRDGGRAGQRSRRGGAGPSASTSTARNGTRAASRASSFAAARSPPPATSSPPVRAAVPRQAWPRLCTSRRAPSRLCAWP
jgi:hypothetical protein